MGQVNVAAIDTLVFKEKKYTMDDSEGLEGEQGGLRGDVSGLPEHTKVWQR